MDGLRYDERVAMSRLRALLELLPTALDRQLVDAGVTSFEYSLLETLHESEAGRLRLSALASRTNATLARLSRVVTALERKGFVSRAACEEDGRATNAVLMQAGEAAFEQARPLYDAAVKGMVLDGLNDDEVTRLADLSYSILSRLDPDRRLSVTTEADCAADPAATPETGGDECPADPSAR